MNDINSIIDILEKKGVGQGQDIHNMNELNAILGNFGLSDSDKNIVKDNFKSRFEAQIDSDNVVKKRRTNNKKINDSNGALSNAVNKEASENVAKQISKNQSKLTSTLKKHGIGFGLNAAFTVNTYNQAREEGDGVLKAGAKAISDFAVGEVLGAWTPLFYLAKSAPQLTISAIEGTQSITRNMNNVSRTQVFGDSQFQDTQQLATMRQAGMEMAKMSQYNLQQSIMGNEAQHMHRI